MGPILSFQSLLEILDKKLWLKIGPWLAGLVLAGLLSLVTPSILYAQFCETYTHTCGATDVPGDPCVVDEMDSDGGSNILGTCYAENLDGTLYEGACIDAQGLQHCTCLFSLSLSLIFPGSPCEGQVDGTACTIEELGIEGTCTFEEGYITSTGETCGSDDCRCLAPDLADSTNGDCPCFSEEGIAEQLKTIREAGSNGFLQCATDAGDPQDPCYQDLPDWVKALASPGVQICQGIVQDPAAGEASGFGLVVFQNFCESFDSTLIRDSSGEVLSGNQLLDAALLTSAQLSSCQEIMAECFFNDNDSDGIFNCVDNCPDDANADQADSDCDGIGDVCDSGGFFPHHPACECIIPGQDPGGGGCDDGSANVTVVSEEEGIHTNHGQYVACVAHALKEEGRQNEKEIKKAAALSDCEMPVPNQE